MIEIGVDIPDSIGRKGPVKLYESSADKQSAYRNRKKNIAFLNKHFASLGCNVNVDGDTCYEPIRKIWGNNQIYKSNNALYYSINIYKTIYDKGAMSCHAFTDFEFIDELFSKMNKNKIKSKNAAHLFNFTIFDKSPDRTRLSNDAIATPVLILDNDGGSLSYKKFIDIFENEKIIVFNTFSSTNSNPRWRAIIPLRRYAFSDEYKLIYKGVLCKLAEHGYVLDKPDPEQPDVRTHGFDLSKSSITSLFYFPCQAKEEGATFYESHIGEERALMDPDSLMELAASYQPKQTVSSVRFIRGNHSLNDAITRWREIGSIPGNGDDEFFKLAVAGFWSGLSADELRQLLIEEASYAHTPQHRLNRVDYLVNWVFTHFVVQKAA